MATFVTDAVCMADLSATLKMSSAAQTMTQSGFWPQVVNLAHINAYNCIFSRLVARGYLPLQIAGWDRGAEVERQLCLYLALVQGGALEAVNDTLLKTYQEITKPKDGLLDRVFLTAGGQWVVPGDTPGTAQAGDPDFTNAPFMGPDAGDPRWQSDNGGWEW